MAKGAKIAYVRVSTEEQNEARQMEALQKCDIDKWFREKVSGKNMSRPQLQAMLEYVREGDTIYVHDWSRISRNLADFLALLKDLENRNIKLISMKEGYDTGTPIGKVIVAVVGAINEFERANLLERQREGIAIAKRKGKYKGRKAVTLPDMAQVYDDFVARRSTKAELARAHGISRPTLDRLLKEYERDYIAGGMA